MSSYVEGGVEGRVPGVFNSVEMTVNELSEPRWEEVGGGVTG